MERTYPPSLGETDVPILLFADDIVLLSTSVGGLQRMLNCLSSYCEEWGLNVNLTKSKIIIFRKRGKPKPVETWKYNGDKVEVVKDYKYLGVNMSANGSWTKHKLA